MRVPGLRDVRTRRFWRILAVQTFACIGFIAVLGGLFDVIQPNAISKVHLPLTWIVLGIAVAYGGFRAWPRPVRQRYSKPNTEISIIEGDLFEQPGNLIIGMCDTFDTLVPHIVQEGGIQGQFLAKIYNHDLAALDKALDDALSSTQPVGSVSKAGKQHRYPIGTIATIRQGRRHFFCTAYSEMSDQNVAQATIDGVWLSLSNLWEEVRATSNSDPVAMAVIGGGLSRLSQVLPAQDSIRFIALSFMFASRNRRVCDRLDIVVRRGDMDNLDMLELKAFLRSLQES